MRDSCHTLAAETRALRARLTTAFTGEGAVEAVAELLVAVRAQPIDRLAALSTTLRRRGDGLLIGTVVAHSGALAVQLSADAARGLARVLDKVGCAGAALDLWDACDRAEAMAAGLADGGAA